MNFLAYVFIFVVVHGPNNIFFFLHDRFIYSQVSNVCVNRDQYLPVSKRNNSLSIKLHFFYINLKKSALTAFVIYFDFDFFFFFMQIKLELKLLLQKIIKGSVILETTAV